MARVFGRDDIPVKDLADDVKRVQRSLDVERTALLLFAGAVILAAVVLTGQAFVRSVRAGSEPVPALRAIGLSRGGLVSGLVAPHVVSVVVAAVVAAVAAIGFSTRFPIGLGRELDPGRGPHVDGAVLAVGVVATIVVTAGTCTLVAWLTVRRAAGGRRAPRTQLVGVATRAGASVPAAVGTSLALERAPTAVGAVGPARTPGRGGGRLRRGGGRDPRRRYRRRAAPAAADRADVGPRGLHGAERGRRYEGPVGHACGHRLRPSVTGPVGGERRGHAPLRARATAGRHPLRDAGGPGAAERRRGGARSRHGGQDPRPHRRQGDGGPVRPALRGDRHHAAGPDAAQLLRRGRVAHACGVAGRGGRCVERGRSADPHPARGAHRRRRH